TSHAAVVLEYRPDDLLITVTDDGRPATGPGGPGRRGLIGLRERVGLYGGELDAGPRPGGGWRVRARIPLEASARLGGASRPGQFGPNSWRRRGEHGYGPRPPGGRRRRPDAGPGRLPADPRRGG